MTFLDRSKLTTILFLALASLTLTHGHAYAKKKTQTKVTVNSFADFKSKFEQQKSEVKSNGERGFRKDIRFEKKGGTPAMDLRLHIGDCTIRKQSCTSKRRMARVHLFYKCQGKKQVGQSQLIRLDSAASRINLDVPECNSGKLKVFYNVYLVGKDWKRDEGRVSTYAALKSTR